MPEQPYERVTADVVRRTGAHPLGEDEAVALLALGKTIAATSDDRRAVPLVCYLLGQSLAGEADAGARVARIRELESELGSP